MAKNRLPTEAGLDISREHILDARFVSLANLRDLIPGLIIAIPVETVSAITGLAVSTIWSKAAQDLRFQQPKQYDGLKRSVWNSWEVQQYLRDRFALSDALSAV
jgi:predicted DNA-binding transcriptional regulator AlpA